MYYIWIFLQIVIGYTLIFPLILLLFSKFSRKKLDQGSLITSEVDYAIIVTAYEQTHLIPEAVNSILKLDYSNYLIYVVADNCNITALNLVNDKIILMRPEQEIASNVGSHFHAIKNFKRKHERLVIIDSDNTVSPDFIRELNIYFDSGFLGVQGLRKPKNLDTPLAAIDAFRDIYYHYYDGMALFGAGSSATLSGSGMGFSVELYKDCMKDHYIKGAGFDKVLQYEIVKKDLRIAFAEKAIVFDVKTSISAQLVQQRSRWLFTWLKYFSLGFKLIQKGLKKLSINQILFGVVLLRPPLFLTLIMSLIFLFINIWVDQVFVAIWAVLLISYLVNFIIPLFQSGVDKRIYKALTHIPEFIFYQIVSLIMIKSATRRSVATRHLSSRGEE
jgi:cellulose synthase/poly-beta-1,6-N-acetylglucosamine synthase-like glycosyltransferase